MNIQIRCSLLALLGVLLFGSVARAEETVWHHRLSPYRAIYTVAAPPAHKQAGIALQVPTCGLGQEHEGRDFFAFTERGNALSLLTLGRGLRNHTLVLVGVPETRTRLYVYFGSGHPGPQNRTAFQPSLLAQVRTFEGALPANERQAEIALQAGRIMGRYFADQISLNYNPIDDRDRFSVEFSGFFAIPQPVLHNFLLVSENAGFLWVNDQLLIARGGAAVAGNALRGEFNHQLRLSRGLHSIRCAVFNQGGPLVALTGRFVDPRTMEVLSAAFFAHPARGELQEVQARARDIKPLFDYSIISYIGYEDEYYHLVELSSMLAAPLFWSLDNGARLHGEKVVTVIPGTGSRTLRVRHGNQELAGDIHFPQNAPPVQSITARPHFDRYVEAMMQLPVEHLDTASLLAYQNFIRYREAHPSLLKIAVELANRPDEVTGRARQAALLDVARTGATRQAETAYNELLQIVSDGDDAQWQERFLEYYDFLLFRLRNPRRAESLWRRLESLEAFAPETLAGLRIDLMLAREEDDGADAARQVFQELIGNPLALREHRQALLRGNALESAFYQHLAEGQLTSAWGILREWDAVSPYHRLSGSFQLARSRLFQEFGWPEAALAVLEQAILFNSNLSLLAEIELARWRILQATGNREEAAALQGKLRSDFPNHPVVREWSP